MMAVSRVVPCCLHSVPGCIKNTDTAFPLNCSSGVKTYAGNVPPIFALVLGLSGVISLSP